MTVPSVVNASTHGRRPVVLYRFMMAPPQPPAETPLDDLIYETWTFEDWTIVTNQCLDPDPTDPRRGMPSIPSRAPLEFNISDCHWPTIFPAATASKLLTGYTPGQQGWWNVQWIGTGHWFEYLQFHINQFTPAHGGGNLYPDISGNKSGTYKVNDDGEIDMHFELQPGSGSLSHHDKYFVQRLRIFLPGDPGSIPGMEGIDYFRTSFRRSVTYAGDVYTPCEIEHTESTQGVEDAAGTIQITLPADDPISLELREPIPPSVPMVAIFEYHRPPVDEPDISNIHSALYEIISAEHDPHTTVLTCSSILGTGDVVVPSGLMQRDFCMFSTYDALTCGINPEGFTFTGTISAIAGLAVTVDGAQAFSADPGFFWLGDFRKGIKHTLIRDQEGDVMILDEMIPGLAVGDQVSLLAGDDRSKETCLNKFNNSSRRLSFPDLPLANPFYGQGLR